MNEKSIVVNLIGGPGTGKSIISAELFAKLKRSGVTCDLSREYIKGKLREQATKATQNQVYIFGKQQFELYTMEREVEVIVSDSPIILCPIYDKTNCSHLKALAIKEFNNYNNLVYYLERDETAEYEQEGRYQDLEGAKKVDLTVKNFLDENAIPYQTLYGIGEASLNKMFVDIQLALGKK